MSMTYWPTWVRHRVPVVFIHPLFLGIPPWTHPGRTPTQLKRWARLAVRRWVLRRAAGNVYISRYIAREVEGDTSGDTDGATGGATGGATAASSGVVIYNPIDPAFRPLADVARTCDVGFFGRMVGEKGVAHLLEAVRLCNDRGHRFTLDLHGGGADLASFQALAGRLGLEGQVRWRDFLRGPALVAAMNAAGVVVVPSTWYEPMGIVAAEAMACGRCVIGSAGGGLGAVLDGVCPTYPNGDSAALAERLIAVLGDPDARAGYERAALARSGDFEQSVIARQYVDYFRTVLARTVLARTVLARAGRPPTA